MKRGAMKLRMTGVMDGSSRGFDIDSHRGCETDDGLQKAVTQLIEMERNKTILAAMME